MITILLLTTSFIGTQSTCSSNNGCGQYATCDHTFIENAIYGCGGEWTGYGVTNGAYLCNSGTAFKQGYSICSSQNVAAGLGLTRELCINDTIQQNYLYVTLQSSLSGNLVCTDDGIDDLFGCTNPTTTSELVYINENNINCGPLGAVLQAANNPWKYGWEPWSGTGASNEELTGTRHLPIKIQNDGGGWDTGTEVWGGVMCCADPIDSPILSTDFSAAQLDRNLEWKSHSIYQILTDRFSKTDISDSTECGDLLDYCGGTFKGILNNLDYIEDLGYDTIWISPIVSNTAKGYHGYWAENIYGINSYFGTENEYLELVTELHSRNMFIMIDIVANHMGYGYNDNDFSMYIPFNESIYYHDSCNNALCFDVANNISCNIYNWDNYNKNARLGIEECRLSGLPDLDQSNTFVADTLCEWLKDYIITKWKADAIRVDTVPEIDIQYWNRLFSTQCSTDDTFVIGEYFWGDPAVLGEYQPTFDSMLGYPMYYTILDVFGRGYSMTDINNRISEYESKFIDYSILGVFTDNHDNNRWLCDFKNITNYKNAILFQHTIPGIPIGYYGTEQLFDGCKDPNNREPLWTSGFDTTSMMYKYISIINRVRTECKIYEGTFDVIHSENDIYVYSRGDNALIILTNNGETFNRTISISNSNSKIAYGKYCNVFAIFKTGIDCFEYNGESETVIYIENGEGKLYVSSSKSMPPTMTYTSGMPTMSPEVTVIDSSESIVPTKAPNASSAPKSNIINGMFKIYVVVFIAFIIH
eukprot:316347_1